MNYDPVAITSALSASREYMPSADAQFDVDVFRFHDKRLRYQLHLLPNNQTGQLAADPVDPIQGCPMLEFSFCCSDVVIGKSAYAQDENEARPQTEEPHANTGPSLAHNNMVHAAKHDRTEQNNTNTTNGKMRERILMTSCLPSFF